MQILRTYDWGVKPSGTIKIVIGDAAYVWDFEILDFFWWGNLEQFINKSPTPYLEANSGKLVKCDYIEPIL